MSSIILFIVFFNIIFGLFNFSLVLSNISLNYSEIGLNQIQNLNDDELTVKIPSVPYHQQINGYYCGPAALEMIMDYYGPDIPQDEIAEVARTYIEYGGTFTWELLRAAKFSNLSYSKGITISGGIKGYSTRKLGYISFEAHLNNTSCLKDLIDCGYPLLVITESGPSSYHFRVIIGYTLYSDGSIREFILNDPWIGPDYIMPYDYFVDLWTSHVNWTLFVSPWKVNISYPKEIKKNEYFLVTANITYPCPKYFDNSEYIASDCSATITLPSGLTLSQGENQTKTLNNGTLRGGNSVLVQWNVTANSVEGTKYLTIQANGLINGSVQAYGIFEAYSYIDKIGGSQTILILSNKESPMGMIITITSISLGGLTIGLSIILLKRRKTKKVVE
ncbi:MAG: C39 family peptidase [Promethearchaeota archaeon]